MACEPSHLPLFIEIVLASAAVVISIIKGSNKQKLILGGTSLAVGLIFMLLIAWTCHICARMTSIFLLLVPLIVLIAVSLISFGAITISFLNPAPVPQPPHPPTPPSQLTSPSSPQSVSLTLLNPTMK